MSGGGRLLIVVRESFVIACDAESHIRAFVCMTRPSLSQRFSCSANRNHSHP
jgi:hypothetical protein